MPEKTKYLAHHFHLHYCTRSQKKIEVYILLKWDDVVSFFPPGLHTLRHTKCSQDICKCGLTT